MCVHLLCDALTSQLRSGVARSGLVVRAGGDSRSNSNGDNVIILNIDTTPPPPAVPVKYLQFVRQVLRCVVRRRACTLFRDVWLCLASVLPACGCAAAVASEPSLLHHVQHRAGVRLHLRKELFLSVVIGARRGRCVCVDAGSGHIAVVPAATCVHRRRFAVRSEGETLSC
jgi:hypothetical protein